MNIISHYALVQFYTRHSDSRKYLETWYKVCKKADWANFHELQQMYPEAFPLGDDRVVFDIKGNRYRLVVRVLFRYKTIQIKWIGTHEQYNRIDVERVNDF